MSTEGPIFPLQSDRALAEARAEAAEAKALEAQGRAYALAHAAQNYMEAVEADDPPQIRATFRHLNPLVGTALAATPEPGEPVGGKPVPAEPAGETEANANALKYWSTRARELDQVRIGLQSALARAQLDACRMHYLGGLIRTRDPDEQAELNALMRKYPPQVRPPGDSPDESKGLSSAWKEVARQNAVAFRDAHRELDDTQTVLTRAEGRVRELSAERNAALTLLQARDVLASEPDNQQWLQLKRDAEATIRRPASAQVEQRDSGQSISANAVDGAEVSKPSSGVAPSRGDSGLLRDGPSEADKGTELAGSGNDSPLRCHNTSSSYIQCRYYSGHAGQCSYERPFEPSPPVTPAPSLPGGFGPVEAFRKELAAMLREMSAAECFSAPVARQLVAAANALESRAAKGGSVSPGSDGRDSSGGTQGRSGR